MQKISLFGFIIYISIKGVFMLDVNRLYPQYSVSTERRKQNVSVPFERRSGLDRRSESRIQLDNNLTKDIFEVRSSLSELQKTTQKSAEKINVDTTAATAAPMAVKADQFVKIEKDKPSESVNNKKEPPSTMALMGGIMAVAMGGVIATTLLGTAGAVIAVGFGAYLGGKILKQAIVNQIVENEKNKKS